MTKKRIKQYITIIKGMNRHGDGRGLMVSRDIAENKVYFCNGHTLLSIPAAIYDQITETENNRIFEETDRDSLKYAQFLETANNEELTTARVLPFMFSIYNGVANIFKSVNNAGDTVFTVVNNIYFEMLAAVSDGCGEFTVVKRAPEKSPVLVNDVYGVSFLALPVHHSDMAKTVKQAFNL